MRGEPATLHNLDLGHGAAVKSQSIVCIVVLSRTRELDKRGLFGGGRIRMTSRWVVRWNTHDEKHKKNKG